MSEVSEGLPKVKSERLREERFWVKASAAVAHALAPTFLSGRLAKESGRAALQSAAALTEVYALYTLASGGSATESIALYSGSRVAAMAAETFSRQTERKRGEVKEGIGYQETFVNKVYLSAARALIPSILSSKMAENPKLAVVQGFAATSELIAIAGLARGQLSPEAAGVMYGVSRLVSLSAEALDKNSENIKSKVEKFRQIGGDFIGVAGGIMIQGANIFSKGAELAFERVSSFRKGGQKVDIGEGHAEPLEENVGGSGGRVGGDGANG